MAHPILKTRAWQKLSRQVVQEEPTCRIQLHGCTGISDTGDHIVPISLHPELALIRSNVRGACRHCNTKRGNNPVQDARPARALDWFSTAR